MNIFTITLRYLLKRPLPTFLNILLLTLGVGLITLSILVVKHLEQRFTKQSKGIDLVIGAKGSPLQLILCNIYHIDLPTGNIYWDDAQKIANNKRYVKKAIPISVGDSYEGTRIIGTTPEYISHFEGKMAQGNIWKKEMEVVVGARVAEEKKLTIGAKFHSSHGLAEDSTLQHKDHDFVVVGILAYNNTILDNLILCNLETIWHVHEHSTKNKMSDEKEITALLIQYKNPLAAINLPRIVNAQTNMQAAATALEVARLFRLIGSGEELIRYAAYLLLGVALLSIFINLWTTLQERSYDIALLRSLGASRWKVMQLLFLESFLITFVGLVFAFALAHSSLFLLNGVGGGQIKFLPTKYYIEELWLALTVIASAFLAALLPALKAYRIDIAKVLAK
ncbi:MAG: FtsX-like permease family protein [Cytophagales bacterium]|nr:MAG: FtsX-like permease family protein [Cytophagales bacterium]